MVYLSTIIRNTYTIRGGRARPPAVQTASLKTRAASRSRMANLQRDAALQRRRCRRLAARLKSADRSLYRLPDYAARSRLEFSRRPFRTAMRSAALCKPISCAASRGSSADLGLSTRPQLACLTKCEPSSNPCFRFDTTAPGCLLSVGRDLGNFSKKLSIQNFANISPVHASV
jgi:hypothetical protein